MVENSCFKKLDSEMLQDYARRWVEHHPGVPIKMVSLRQCSSRWLEACRLSSERLEACLANDKDKDKTPRYPLYAIVFEIEGLVWGAPNESITDPIFPIIVDNGDLERKAALINFLEKVDNVPGRRRHDRNPFMYGGFDDIYRIQPREDFFREWVFLAAGIGDTDTLPDYIDSKSPKSPKLLLFGHQEETVKADVLQRKIPRTGKKTGRPRDEVFRPLLEKLFLELLESGDTDCLLQRRVCAFLEKLNNRIKTGSPVRSDEFANVISKVTNIKGDCKIILHDLPMQKKTKGRRGEEISTTTKPYTKKDVSNELSKLRDKYSSHPNFPAEKL